MLNINFEVKAICEKLDDSKEKLELALVFDLNSAEKFFSRFSNNSDITTADNKYKIKFNYSADGNIIGIILISDEYGSMIIINPKEVAIMVITGYNKVITLNKVNNMLDFDFETANDLFNMTEELE